MKTNISAVLIIVLLIGAFVALRPDEQESIGTIVEMENTATSSLSATSDPAKYSLAEISVHKDAKSCYTVIDGSVYDLTKWIEVHPGGVESILILCGRDGTKEFMGQHGTNNEALMRLASFKIGILR